MTMISRQVLNFRAGLTLDAWLLTLNNCFLPIMRKIKLYTSQNLKLLIALMLGLRGITHKRGATAVSIKVLRTEVIM